MKKYYWPALSVALFLIPELIWSPLLNILLGFFIPNYIFRNSNFGDFSNNTISFIIFIQSIGLLGLTIHLFRNYKQSKKVGFLIAGIFLSLASIVSLFVLWLTFVLRNIGF